MQTSVFLFFWSRSSAVKHMKSHMLLTMFTWRVEDGEKYLDKNQLHAGPAEFGKVVCMQTDN